MLDGDALHFARGHMSAVERCNLLAVACYDDFAFAEWFVDTKEYFCIRKGCDMLRDGVGYAWAG